VLGATRRCSNALDLRLRTVEIVITVHGEITRFAAAAMKLPYFERVVLRAPSEDALPAGHPGAGQDQGLPETAAFVCVGETCSTPITRPDLIAQIVDIMREKNPRRRERYNHGPKS